MNDCLKALRKIPMAMVGAIDLSVCSAAWAVNQLAKRGEKVVAGITNPHSKTSCCHGHCDCDDEMTTEHP